MKRPRMEYVRLQQLNAAAVAIAQAGASSAEAVREAARQANLILVRSEAQRILYRSRRGTFVNAWLDGPHGAYLGPGGAGFDDQIDWADAS